MALNAVFLLAGFGLGMAAVTLIWSRQLNIDLRALGERIERFEGVYDKR